MPQQPGKYFFKPSNNIKFDKFDRKPQKKFDFVRESACDSMRIGSNIYNENDRFLENDWRTYLFDNTERILVELKGTPLYKQSFQI